MHKKQSRGIASLWRQMSHTVRRVLPTISRTRRRPRLSSQRYLHIPIPSKHQVTIGIIAVLGVCTLVYTIYQLYRYYGPHTYALATAEKLLAAPSNAIAPSLTFDKAKQQFSFAHGTASTAESRTGTSPVAATIPVDAAKGVTVTDPTYKLDLSLVPKFDTAEGKQDKNRITYPLRDQSGWLVYTTQGTGIKEDIVLSRRTSDTRSFDYQLKLPSGTEARIEKDGSIGVYGNSVFMANISAATENDAALLEKARKQSKKTKLLFVIPAPVIIESGRARSTVKATYDLRGDKLTVKASGLATAHYPLTIDPSIYIVTAQQFMNGNNETNINFDVANKLIKKGRTTGARFDTWTATADLPSAMWATGTAVAGGYIYTTGGIVASGKTFTAQGADTFTVPAGITSITVKAWGGGGGGGGSGTNSTTTGGAGGGAGYVSNTFTVTSGETLDIYVGGGGSGGTKATYSGGGGGGGGASTVKRGANILSLAAGGGGGGGADNVTAGAGGAGGGTTGVAGTASGAAGSGKAGTATAGGAGGTGGNAAGQAGGSLLGGAGGLGSGTGTGGGGTGGLLSGGAGGGTGTSDYAGGGGGGMGFWGGGGGAGANQTNYTGGGGGGGGSSRTTGTVVANTAGSGINPGNAADLARNGAGTGGAGGTIGNTGTRGNNGLVAITYGSGGSSASAAVSWGQFNANNGTIDSPNPGTGACSGWCTSSDYNLPAPRANHALVAYNGYLYAIGGTDSSGVRQSTIYIAKLGANGEPQLWHPTNSNQSTWVYWYQDTGLSSIRSNLGAVAYNNRLYIVGGIGASTPVNTVEIADIKPTGQLGGWSTTATLPSAVYGHSLQAYNDRLYVLGGAATVGGAPTSNVYYNKINADGSLNTWITTSNFSGGRISGGGDMSTVWGAYIYLSGGCTAVNASGYCTNVASDTQVASINADGSLDAWNLVGTVSNKRMGFGMIAWRDYIYEIGGCTVQNTASPGDCNAGVTSSIIYGIVNQDGDASTVGQSVASGTAPCAGATPTGCNLPGDTLIGNLLANAIISNGYLYVIGGCVTDTCNNTTGNTAYVSISATGQLTKPATCPAPRTIQGNVWCVDTTNTVGSGVAASGITVFNNRMYIVGGLRGNGNVGAIYRSDINQVDGSLSAWTAQNFTTLGAGSVAYLYAYSRANPVNAGSAPGNLYFFGGCSNTSSAGCTAYSDAVYKCDIQPAGAIANCSTSGQLQIGTIPGDSATGLGIMSGTVYANYIYLIGGVSPGQTDLATVRYAKIDNNNNVVPVSGGTWIESPNKMLMGRRRSAAFGYNGYLYAIGGYDGTTGGGVLADIEFIKINVSDGSLGDASTPWKASAVTINQRWGLTVPISNSYAYVIGGCTSGPSPGGCTVRTDMIQTFQVYNNDSGAPAGYSTATNYTTDPNRIGGSATILNGYIYMAGGCTGTTDCATPTANVSYAPIDPNGTIGTWANTNVALPNARAWGKLLSTSNSLYYVGGVDSTNTNQSTVYYATPNNGNITGWGTASNALPNARSRFGGAVWNGRLYVVGGSGTGTGCTASNVCNTTYVSPQLPNGGDIPTAWSTASTGFNVARTGAAAVAYANNLYLFGGFDGTNYLSDTQYSQINGTTGNAGAWSYSESLPSALSQSDAFAANGYIYLMGGRSSATTCAPVTMVAPVSANTTIASGNNPTGVGSWFVTNQRYTGARYGAAVAYNDGKAYVLGGGCGATLTYATPSVQQTALLSQPQLAKYSILLDTDSDTFPNYWLLNGLDNSIGARWQLKYTSMADQLAATKCATMTTWGQTTNFGNVTLGTPGAYVVRDGVGNNISCARYFFFNITVDSTQAFGYPDDVSRGPTITDLTLQFTANPSKRLMHGRTFAGGLQMPDDTPYYSN